MAFELRLVPYVVDQLAERDGALLALGRRLAQPADDDGPDAGERPRAPYYRIPAINMKDFRILIK